VPVRRFQTDFLWWNKVSKIEVLGFIKVKQESRAVAGNPRDAAVIFDP